MASDQLHRFLFSEKNIRGEFVRLNDSLQQILSAQPYPEELQSLLGELLAATCLLTATLKFEGEISLQLQSEGVVKYAVINGNHRQEFRGVARWDGDLSGLSLSEMLPKGVLLITIKPDKGEQYQGVVALDKETLGACLESYFAQSEQLPTQVQLLTGETGAGVVATGLFLQVLPESAESSMSAENEALSHLWQLAKTLTKDEAFTLAPQDILFRLFHEEHVELFEPVAVQFKCTCSKEKSAVALRSVAKEELLEIITQRGKIAMNCQYCHALYEYDAIDVETLHSNVDMPSSMQ
ncbi:MAG: Hsp33 family molecular chaperone HslO [Aestuariibacter sp.]